MSVFNIATAALILQATQSQSPQATQSPINNDECALAVVSLTLRCNGIYEYLFKKQEISNTEVGVIFTLIISIYDIIYSSFIINYHNNNRSVDTYINNMSIAVIVLNSIHICFGPCFKTKEPQNEKPKQIDIV